MRIHILAYMEDEKLTVGARSKTRFIGSHADEEWYYNYYTIDKESVDLEINMQVEYTGTSYKFHSDDFFMDEVIIANGNSVTFDISH